MQNFMYTLLQKYFSLKVFHCCKINSQAHESINAFCLQIPYFDNFRFYPNLTVSILSEFPLLINDSSAFVMNDKRGARIINLIKGKLCSVCTNKVR